MLYFYEVVPAYRKYHGREPLTYHYNAKLKTGAVVVVKIRKEAVQAVVVGKVFEPSFKTKPLDEILGLALPGPTLALLEWTCEYYPGPGGLIGQLFLPSSLKGHKPVDHKKSRQQKVAGQPPLSKDQSRALSLVAKSHATTIVLHGDTATGKTRVYLELAKKVIDDGKTVLILTPEIALTPQLVDSFNQAFDQTVYVTHSGLTPAQKRDIWAEIAISIPPVIVIGPRSALFMPIDDLGLIVVDEFHETAYKQEASPYYHASRVASRLSVIHNCLLVFGSATPPVNDYYVAEQKNALIIRMREKPLLNAKDSRLEIKIVDLSDEREKSKHSLLSGSLISAIETALKQKEQSLLFLNKRGSARVILCQNCAWRATCERCGLPFTYHSDGHYIQCHTCGNKQSAPNSCPECKSTDIIFKSPGTKAVADAISKLFPGARVARFDKDNLKKDRFEQRHSELVSGGIDILVGTQLIAKGHDLPKLSTVGILLAENGLQFPDYTSEERSYQLIKQLIGRVNRGHGAGKVILQTYDPGNPAIKSALANDGWKTFYTSQLENRKLHGFPPFYHVLKIEVARASSASAEGAAEQIAEHLSENFSAVEILGPHPSFLERKNNRYSWQIIVKSKTRARLLDIMKENPLNCTYDIDPMHLM